MIGAPHGILLPFKRLPQGRFNVNEETGESGMTGLDIAEMGEYQDIVDAILQYNDKIDHGE